MEMDLYNLLQTGNIVVDRNGEKGIVVVDDSKLDAEGQATIYIAHEDYKVDVRRNYDLDLRGQWFGEDIMKIVESNLTAIREHGLDAAKYGKVLWQRPEECYECTH
ncbi:hypothetical protein [Selenomonas ruminis]|uniref:Uncharacterized protein n=1 Tax=Selenomonas ruminis TaxID=2593411 RepID=A0A5D6VX59_9FIRM|nr:hypothetical protein [Selenomonas sp. mPRGC5]MBO5651325.1 hypothetical protein [Selenomonas sp.]TYZ20057.1 hypothetical protein FZ040_12370 [Selenomonas sp. mPRGC5]